MASPNDDFADSPIGRPRALSALAQLDTVLIADISVHLATEMAALDLIVKAAEGRTRPPLGVVSVNLDHVHHFGGSWSTKQEEAGSVDGSVAWLNLIDGAPIASQVRRLSGVSYPKLSGSDLIEPVLSQASRRELCLAVLGGTSDVTPKLKARLATEWPGINFAGHWTPDRPALESPAESRKIAQAIREAHPDIVLVCLGKPRQEKWIAAHGAETGAGVLLAFGAVVDFLAGRVARAPQWVSSAGLEWVWRLGREPKRLARRYLVQGPPAYLAVRRSG